MAKPKTTRYALASGDGRQATIVSLPARLSPEELRAAAEAAGVDAAEVARFVRVLTRISEVLDDEQDITPADVMSVAASLLGGALLHCPAEFQAETVATISEALYTQIGARVQ